MACDEELSESFSIEQKKVYVYLLMKLVEEGKKQKKYALSFGGRKTKNFKRRVYGIMKENRGKRRIAKGLILTMVFMVILGASAFAKEMDFPVEKVFSDDTVVFDESEFSEGTDWMMEIEEDIAQYESLDEIQLIEDDLDAEINHTHSFVDTKVNQHKKNSNGSCVVTIYYAEKCSSCGAYKLGDVYNTLSYGKCIH